MDTFKDNPDGTVSVFLPNGICSYRHCSKPVPKNGPYYPYCSELHEDLADETEDES